MSAVAQLEPRASGRADPVTPWRHDLAHLADEIAKMICKHEDPENQFRTATYVGQDIVHVVKQKLRKQYGKVFDPLLDGPAR